ncbi:hypothetical protein EXIGLDRAFT_761637 [Exidia glandulosa HHB12029]|uniref:F-box domain-containing protein n=1 Tax=Exidia glandulosa HHB12029 TaxID=1314781 RepID=A0A165NCQ2_EXIGL|nr:hypothetical protein EXIGLDRAFT_761637 [Exidia glandulosa HHB12029]
MDDPTPAPRPTLATIPPEVLLHIFIYVDMPELTALARSSRTFRAVALDPALHRVRLRVVAPARVEHALEPGLRPTLVDLCQRNLIRGLGIERRWRSGLYFYSPQSVKQFEASQRLQRIHVRDLLLAHFRSRPVPLYPADTRLMPVAEGSSFQIARSLLPVMRKLKFAIQRDVLSRQVRARGGVSAWLESSGRGLETERVRLAVCPGVRKVVRFWEGLANA